MTGTLGAQAAAYVAASGARDYPDDVIDLAKMCLADWVCVALGAVHEPAGVHVGKVVGAWNARGPAPVVSGNPQPAALAALINGTFVHCLDYDDVHFPSLAHLSAPTWAAVLGLAAETPRTPGRLLECFVTGFEIGARLGSNGVGAAVLDRGWHSTGVVGRLAATAAAAALLDLDAPGVARALGIAATQTSGLTGSFGTDSKPLHAGKAAFDAVFSAQLAASGFRGATDLLDRQGGLIDALVQSDPPALRLDDLADNWEIRNNALKPYACCGLTHAAIDSARALAPAIGERTIARIEVDAHPLASKVAAQIDVAEPLAAKFSIAFCTALGLHGHRATARDFSVERIAETELKRLARVVELHKVDALAPTAAQVRLTFDDGTTAMHFTSVSLGNPGNPMSWDDLRVKFIALVQPEIGDRSLRLFDHIRNFEVSGDVQELWDIVFAAVPPAAVAQRRMQPEVVTLSGH